MEAITLPIYNNEGKEVDSIKLDTQVFDGKVNPEVIYQAVTAYRANQRKGLASTKTRGEVSGGGKKPWRQKGTGRARVGSTRSPLWRHGGVVFGPHKRDYSYNIPAKIRAAALKSSLNAKVKESNFCIIESFANFQQPKTKEAAVILSRKPFSLSAKNKMLLLLKQTDDQLKKSLRNIGSLTFNLAKDTHAYEVLTHTKVVITREALNELINRLKK